VGTLTDPIAALDAMAADPGWRWPWRYRCRTARRDDGTWQAEVQAGYFDANWKPIGATPRWGGAGATEAEALAKAAQSAIDYCLRIGPQP
jgi:hypothetical protein